MRHVPEPDRKPDSVSRGQAAAITEAADALEAGDLLLAFDRATQHLQHFPDNETLMHLGVLALARAGATEEAARCFADWGLEASGDGHVRALAARLAKDRALKRAGTERRAALAEAAAAYQRIYAASPDTYQAINWASLAFLSGAVAEAKEVAATVLTDPAITRGDDYWSLATRAEAQLLLGRLQAARADLQAAAAQADGGTGARSTTRRQLRLILAEAGIGKTEISEFLAPLAQPVTLYFRDAIAAGNGWGAFADAVFLNAVRVRLARAINEIVPGAIFGSLGTPAEILFAEVALSTGAELHLVLPVPLETFAERFIAPAGPDWLSRFDNCRRQASRVVSVSDDADVDDPALAGNAVSTAMGLALLRAEHIDGAAVQIVLNGERSGREAPGHDAWHRGGRQSVVWPLQSDVVTSGAAEQSSARQCYAFVFGDLPGFSRLPERYLPVFWDTIMAEIGSVVAAWSNAVVLKNTWGDAVHLVVSDVRAAAEICVAVQARLAAVEANILGRSEPASMRIGAHYGPAFAGWDPVRDQPTYYGRALSRAARIEPITPPGRVYVTEAFAAALLLEHGNAFACTYVGQVPLAKGYGTFRMYDLG